MPNAGAGVGFVMDSGWVRLPPVRTTKYRLEPALRVRTARVDDATRDLAGAVRARELAEKKRVAAEEAQARADEAARVVRDAERAALEDGRRSAGELVRGDAWEARMRAEAAEHAKRVAQARTQEGGATRAEQGAQKNLASKKADAEVIAKDRARWDERERRAREASEEEAAAEAWRPKRT